MEKRFLNTREIAALFGVHPNNVTRLIARGECPPPSLRPGRKGQKWRAKLVEDWLARLEKQTLAGHSRRQADRILDAAGI